MTPEMLDDVHTLAPRVAAWLKKIGAPLRPRRHPTSRTRRNWRRRHDRRAPLLADLVEEHQGYPNIPSSAWIEFDKAMEKFREAVRTKHLPERRRAESGKLSEALRRSGAPKEEAAA
jgi:hypothetical protein